MSTAIEAAAAAGSPDAGSLGGGHAFPSAVVCDLDAEGERTADAEDEKDYDQANRQLEAMLAAARTRLRSFQGALSRTRQVFVRENGKCGAWDLRQDWNSASGWISREDALTSGGRQLSEFRFAADTEGVRLTGWIYTALPSIQPASEEIRRGLGPLCEAWTTLVDASASAAKFTDQVWFFSAPRAREAQPTWHPTPRASVRRASARDGDSPDPGDRRADRPEDGRIAPVLRCPRGRAWAPDVYRATVAGCGPSTT